jgi:hypothetical protein
MALEDGPVPLVYDMQRSVVVSAGIATEDIAV